MTTWYSRARRTFTPTDRAPADNATSRPKRVELMSPADVIGRADDESAGWWSSSLELSNGVTVTESDDQASARDKN